MVGVSHARRLTVYSIAMCNIWRVAINGCGMMLQVEHSFNTESNCLEFKSTDTHARGEQVFINYGRYTNCHLLRLYGFTIENNPHDAIDIWATMRFVLSHTHTLSVSVSVWRYQRTDTHSPAHWRW